MGESGTDRGGGEAASSKENLASSTQVVIEWIDDESAAVYNVITKVEAMESALALYSHETGCQEDDRIDTPHDPLVSTCRVWS